MQTIKNCLLNLPLISLKACFSIYYTKTTIILSLKKIAEIKKLMEIVDRNIKNEHKFLMLPVFINNQNKYNYGGYAILLARTPTSQGEKTKAINTHSLSALRCSNNNT